MYVMVSTEGALWLMIYNPEVEWCLEEAIPLN
jgi:hypothetical protein